MFQRKVAKKAVGCLMALTMVMTNSYMGINVGGPAENVAYAEEGELSYTIGNSTYKYEVLEDGSIEITDYEGTDTEIVIPTEIEGKSVTSIGDFAFQSCGLTSIEIPNSVTSIENSAFSGCRSLTSIKIPNSVTSIGWGAFSGCSSLTSVEIPDSVTSIGREAFLECRSLESVKIPNSVTSIGYSTFSECSNLEQINVDEGNKNYKSQDGILFSVDMSKIIMHPEGKKDESYIIPNSVTSIGDLAFRGCSSLTSIKIPNSVTSIGRGAFSGCSSLTSVDIPNSVTSIGYSPFSECSNLEQINVEEENGNYKSEAGVLYNYDMSELIKYPECKKDESYMIPNSVTSIGDLAFSGCRSLISVDIPNSVTGIGYSPFSECSNLEQINVEEENGNYKSEAGVLYNYDMSELIKYPEGKKDESYIIPKSVTEISSDAFIKNVYLEKIEIEEGNQNYESQDGVLFNADMSKLIRYPEGKKEKIYAIPKSVIEIGYGAFLDCSSLTSIEIPATVTDISYDAFEDCENIIIYGDKASYAEIYAYNNNIPFVTLKTILDESTNINIKCTEDTIGENIFLKTKQLSDTDEEYKNIILTEKIADSKVNPEDVKFSAYDISLVDVNNSPVQPNGTVTVKIPCPADYNGENCKVYRVEESGEFTDMNAKYQNGYMVFETDHFSTYIITETELIIGIQVVKGDANGDGNMDIKDSAIIKRYLAGWDVEIDTTAADLDGDGKVTIKDSALIKRQLAGWE